jgi:hypothetical protein
MKLPKLKGRTALAAAVVAILAGAGALSLATARQIDPGMKPAYLKKFPDFAPDLTPQMPGDVDIKLKTELEKTQQFAKVQREFDLYSWQMFLALNWPTDGTGKAAPKLTDTSFGAPHWTLWHSSNDIFQTDGATPDACKVQTAARAEALLKKALNKPVSKGLNAFSTANIAADLRGTRYLGVMSAVGELNAATTLSEIGQAFTGPLIDQNGEFVFYEILMDPNEVSYVCQNGLYNINGQVAFSGAGKTVSMPSGTPDKDWSGSFELKLAWKIMTPGKDDASRFYTMPAVIMDQGPDGKPVERKVTVGLVGMHIGHKSQTSPQWIWSTFEQIDNLAVDPIMHPKLNPSFNDPNCEICTVNQLPIADANGNFARVPTQASRTIPIPPDKQALNAQAQAELRRQGSVWQFYQLIDTQWPTSPTTKPTPWNAGLGGSVENKPGGNPTPVMLTNITMETYFQAGNQQACNAQENVPNDANCVSPPSAQASAAPPIWTSPLNNSTDPDAGLPGINTTIFATESCMGCHSSAGIYTSYDPANPNAAGQSGQLTGDFSWLFSQKAAWNASAGTAAKPRPKKKS